MELVAKNLLVCITALASLAFGCVWANKQNTPFEMEFSFMRKKNRRKDLILGGKIIVVVSLVSYAFYGAGIYVCKTSVGLDVLSVAEAPVRGLLLPVLVMIYHLFWMSEGHVGKKGARFALNIFLLFASPSILIMLMQFMRTELDQYAGYLSVAMLPLIIWAAYKNQKAWREGDY